jgi:hypothetical protein
MKAGHSFALVIFSLILAGSILLVPGCATKDDDPGPTDTRYTCDGSLSQCLKIKSGWTLDVKATDEIVIDPSVVALPDGRFRIYGNDTAQGIRHIISLISVDGGVTFALEPGFRVVGDPDHDAFFADVIALPSGQYRMYLTDQRTVIASEGAPAFISAISDDGLNFAWESGERLHYSGTGDEASGIRNQNVVLLPNGTFRMYYAAGGKVLSAVSPDGLSFSRESGVRYVPSSLCPAVTSGRVNPKVYLDLNGTFHLFTSSSACDDALFTNEKIGIFEGTSTDGLTFAFTKTAVVQGYYVKSLYHGNPSDPFVNAEDPMLVWTPAGLRMYFSCGGPANNPPARYYSLFNPSIH